MELRSKMRTHIKAVIAAVEKGCENLEHLIGVIRSYGLPVVAAINEFPSDTSEEIDIVNTIIIKYKISRMGWARFSSSSLSEKSFLYY